MVLQIITWKYLPHEETLFVFDRLDGWLYKITIFFMFMLLVMDKIVNDSCHKAFRD